MPYMINTADIGTKMLKMGTMESLGKVEGEIKEFFKDRVW
jgi:hypothetical protein